MMVPLSSKVNGCGTAVAALARLDRAVSVALTSRASGSWATIIVQARRGEAAWLVSLVLPCRIGGDGTDVDP